MEIVRRCLSTPTTVISIQFGKPVQHPGIHPDYKCSDLDLHNCTIMLKKKTISRLYLAFGHLVSCDLNLPCFTGSGEGNDYLKRCCMGGSGNTTDF